jgi:hypothetical protein
MAADKRPKNRNRESGQSILEFLLMLPMLVGLFLILLRVNQAIQVSIVDQQYARAHALWLAFNNPVFPQQKLRLGAITAQQDNQMVIGVSDNTAPTDGSRKKGVHDSDDKESSKRASVRVRDTVTICTQANVVQGKSGFVPILPQDPSSFAATGAYNLTEDPHQFAFCRSNLQYVVDAGGDSGP